MSVAGVETGEKMFCGAQTELAAATLVAAIKTMPQVATQADELDLKCFCIAFSPNNQWINGDQAFNPCRARAIDVSEHSDFSIRVQLYVERNRIRASLISSESFVKSTWIKCR
jgi:hypothetical protein